MSIIITKECKRQSSVTTQHTKVWVHEQCVNWRSVVGCFSAFSGPGLQRHGLSQMTSLTGQVWFSLLCHHRWQRQAWRISLFFPPYDTLMCELHTTICKRRASLDMFLLTHKNRRDNTQPKIKSVLRSTLSLIELDFLVLLKTGRFATPTGRCSSKPGDLRLPIHYLIYEKIVLDSHAIWPKFSTVPINQV